MDKIRRQQLEEEALRDIKQKAESDLYGLNQHVPGAKLDAGKPRVSLVLGGFANALWAVSEVGTYGANKYTPNGWLSVPEWQERYTNALMRHQLAELGGETHDQDTGFLHAAHAAWNALARLEKILRDNKEVQP